MGIAVKKKTVLITGINGFLGSHLAKRLSGDFNIIGLEKKIDHLNRLKGFSFKVYSSDNLERLFKENKIFAVIHAATVYRKENEPYDILLNSNIILPVILFDMSHKNGVELFLNTDSFFNKTNTKYNYLQEYTLSKRHAIEWLKLIKGSCKLINVKLYHIFGPEDSLHKFVQKTITALINNNNHIDLTLGDQKRDFIYIDDVVSAFGSILKNSSRLKKDTHEFEVGTGKAISIKKFVKIAKKIAGSKSELNFGAIPYRKNEIRYSKANIGELVELGWKPETALIDGIKQIINFEKNKIKK